MWLNCQELLQVLWGEGMKDILNNILKQLKRNYEPLLYIIGITITIVCYDLVLYSSILSLSIIIIDKLFFKFGLRRLIGKFPGLNYPKDLLEYETLLYCILTILIQFTLTLIS